ncbi:MAG: MalY/PatB family protein [Planctomycetia bacterium]|nr:MalY/PatB family protein [Planctomycetia bacterium]
MINPFDEKIDRRNRYSVKYDFYDKYGKSPDHLPMWVADMDFRSPPEILDALREMADYGVFGYSHMSENYKNAIGSWFRNRFDWEVPMDGILQIPNIMFGIASLLNCLSKKGDSVLIQEPVYHPFREVVQENDRNLVVNELVYKNGRYEIDFEDLEDRIRKNRVKIFLLCSPHNPVGRVWTREELEQIGAIMLRNRVFVVSDEIHADLVYPGSKHRVFASLGKELQRNCAVCSSPTKTFNIPGLHTANLFISDPEIYRRMEKEVLRYFYYGISLPGLIAAEKAYTCCGAWKDELLIYLEENIRFVSNSLKELGDKIDPIRPEATYLLWLDCRKMDLSDHDLDRFFSEKAGLWLSPGTEFGQGGSGFMRMNLATARSNLQEAVRRIANALS